MRGVLQREALGHGFTRMSYTDLYSDSVNEIRVNLWLLLRGALDFDAEFFEFAIEGWSRETKNLRASSDVA